MLGSNNLYLFSFDIQDKIDFINEESIQSFLLVEEAGGGLPTFEFSFDGDDELVQYLTEGNTIKVNFGQNRDNIRSTNLLITKFSSVKFSENSRRFLLKGFYNAPTYLSDTKLRVLNSSSVEAIKTLGDWHFLIDSNVDVGFRDTQKWIQYNIPDKVFLSNIWLHSRLPNDSFLLIGINSEGKLILRDIKKLISRRDYSWKFSDLPEDSEKTILINPGPVFASDAGFINNWVGYGLESDIVNLNSGEYSNFNSEPQPLLGISDKLSRVESIKTKYKSAGVSSRNTHDNYFKAYLDNLTKLAVCSSFKTTLSFSNIFAPVQVLDHCLFMETSTESEKNAEYHSGSYIISKVSRNLIKRNLTTIVELDRDISNQPIGDIR